LKTTKFTVICDDVNCEFKRVVGDRKHKRAECMVELKDAIRFLERHNASTCEVGMGQVQLGSAEDNKKIIYKLKYRGRV
jgi:hypothetical protein